MHISCTLLWNPFGRPEVVLSPFILMGEMNVITDYDQFDPFFTRHVSSKHFETKMAFFRHTNQEKINFVRDLSLSQQHIVVRSGNWCFLPCFTTDINGHLNGLVGETMNWKLKLTSNKYHATQNPSALIYSLDVITLPDKAEEWWFPSYLYWRCDSAHLKTGSVAYTISHHCRSVQWGILCWYLHLHSTGGGVRGQRLSWLLSWRWDLVWSDFHKHKHKPLH